MSRLIVNFPKRQQYLLDGIWDFQPETRKPKKVPIEFTEKLSVPGVWESAFRHFAHRGYGWYRREFEVTTDGPVDMRLVFDAVSYTARVWLDGDYLGEHYGAHTAFAFYCKAIKPGTHELIICADNTFGPHNTFTRPSQDIYTYGGIVRSVHAEILPEIFVEYAHAIPRKKGREWELCIEIKLKGRRGSLVPKNVVVRLNEKELGKIPISSKGFGSGRLPVRNISLWSPESPCLYTVSITAGNDVWQERIGFRTISTRGRKILLNDAPITLRGVNRHECHPDFGSALPATIQLRDIEILKSLGANFVRGSHYPNDPLFLDLCDEHGILFWEEISHWQPSAADMELPLFRKQSLQEIDEMVHQHRHHPSIILWGMLNEGATDCPIAREVVGLFAGRFRKLDPTRLITYGSNKPHDDVAFDQVDVASINVYPGWYPYRGQDRADLADIENVLKDVLRSVKSRARRKPIIFSEFGAGGLRGNRSFEMRKWTEDFQSELLCRILKFARQCGVVSGVALWQYCDVRTSADIAIRRPGEYNNKGILTACREPKLAFHRVADEFRKPWAILQKGKDHP